MLAMSLMRVRIRRIVPCACRGRIPGPRNYVADMAYTIRDLRNLSDDDLIAEHDKIAPNTMVGTQYYRDEIRAREFQRAAEKADEIAAASLEVARQATFLARRAYVLAFVSAVVGTVAVVLQVIALL